MGISSDGSTSLLTKLNLLLNHMRQIKHLRSQVTFGNLQSVFSREIFVNFVCLQVASETKVCQC